MIAETLTRELKQIAGPGQVWSGRVGAEVYSYDASLASGAPETIVFPANAAETAAVVRALARAGVACTPRGFGTNLSGGSIALKGGVVLCLSRLNRILEIKPERRCARVQCGVTNLEVQNALAPLGYYYAPDPASQKVATLGGNVGENSGGPHCLKYGVTTNHILGLELVLPGGEQLNAGGPALDPPGYDLRGLFIGSEGTFGVATEITLRILPKPEAVLTLLAIYQSVAAAAHSVSEIIARGLVPATLEMMDAVVLRAVEDSFPCGYPRDAAAVLIIEVEGPAAGLRAQADEIKKVCTAQGCRTIREAKDDAERSQLWAGRRGAFGAVARIAPNYLVADCTVPRTRLPEALEQVQALARQHGCLCGNVLHAGDGNLHPLLLFDARDPAQLRQVHAAGHAIIAACVKLGGTITGEHGVGVEKIDSMRLICSEEDLDYQRLIRQVFDPRNLFNPGKVIPEPREQPAGASPDPRPNQAVQKAGNLELAEEFAPADQAEVCALVRAAISRGWALLPLGGGRRADFGNRSEVAAVPLSSRKLNTVVDYDPANQVAVLGAGLKLQTLQATLGAQRQWLPLRPPLADGCTLGGVVAIGACGPERACYGAPRDRLLGLRFVSGMAWPISAGARVVKNVAGYDVTRLLAGSAGTLGVLTELTFRVSAIPEVCRAVRACGALSRCAEAARTLLGSSLEPVFVTALPGSRPAQWEFSVGFEGFETMVRAQTKGAGALLRAAGLEVRAEDDYPLLEGVHARVFARIFDCAFVLRADLPLDATVHFARAMRGAEEPGAGGTPVEIAPPSSLTGRMPVVQRAACPLHPPREPDGKTTAVLATGGDATQSVLLDWACGRVWAGQSALPDEQWAALCAQARQAGGHVILEKAPAEFKRRHDVFGPFRPEWKWTHRMKTALDPHGVFAPGRLPGRK